jgi:hypothetical protein
MSLLSLIPGKDLFYGAVIVVLLLFGWHEVNHLKAEGAAKEVTALQVSSAKLTAAAQKQVQETATNYASTLVTVKENLDGQVKAAATQHDIDAQRLREYDAYRRQHPAVASAGTGPSGQSAGSTSAGSDEPRLASLEQVALGLADGGREVSIALTSCVKERESLTGK